MLLRYFKKKDDLLPNPSGPLSFRMPSAAIAAANQEVKDLVSRVSDAEDAADTTKKTGRGQYFSYCRQRKSSLREHQNLVSQPLSGSSVKSLSTDL